MLNELPMSELTELANDMGHHTFDLISQTINQATSQPIVRNIAAIASVKLAKHPLTPQDILQMIIKSAQDQLNNIS